MTDDQLTYIEAATQALHDALRAQGKDPAACLTPDLQQLYVLLVLSRGELATLVDVHDAWAVARATERPDHPDLVPFYELSDEVKAYDEPFMRAIHSAGRQLGGWS